MQCSELPLPAAYSSYAVGRKRVDVALEVDDLWIAVEYDAWYWHAGREELDIQRDDFLLERGWQSTETEVLVSFQQVVP